MSGGGAGRLEAVTSGGAANAAVNAGGEATKRAGEKEGGRRPLLLGDRVEVGRGREGKVDGAEGSGSFNELNKLVVTTLEPLETVRASESRTKSEGRARRI